VEGIWYLIKDSNQRYLSAIKQLRLGLLLPAMRTLLTERKKVSWSYLVLIWMSQRSWFQKNKQVVWHFFVAWLSLINPESRDWYQYLKHRDGRSTFILSLLSTGLLHDAATMVDIGCGKGNFLAKVNQISGVKKRIGIDISFSLLLLARWFEVDESVRLIACDIETGSPLPPKCADLITINDAFMYVKNKSTVVRQLVDNLTQTGVLAIVHVHIKHTHNLGQGFGVSFKEIKHYAAGWALALAFDQQLLKTMLLNGRVRFKAWSNRADQARSCSFIISRNAIPHQWKLPHRAQQLIHQTKIDYTEDEDLRPN
jgi:SAM-dependent methyltransferase